MNYKITIAYDGTEYQGWQLQGTKPTIQLKLNQALAKVTGIPVVVHGAGRTDSGVHAEGQVATFHLPCEWTEQSLRNAINGNLPRDIRVLTAERVEDNFHARFSAKGKTYCYQVYGAEIMNPLLTRFAWHYAYPLDRERIACEGQALLGTHDFTGFTVASCETTTKVRTITEFRLECQGSLLQFYFKGDGFLRYQVRTMVMALVEISRKRLQLPMSELIQRRQRELIRGSAPAQGLTLLAVEY